MGLFDRNVNGFVNGLLNRASNAIGNAAGAAIGEAVDKIADQAVDNVTSDMKMNNERKQMALEQDKKAMNLPTHCPHCGAGTNGKLVCDYCDCKIVE